LGGYLLKKRVARPGQGKRGGYRTLIAFKHPYDKNAFFIFGFSKNERDNITQDEKEIYKKLAEFYIGLTAAQLKKLLEQETLFEVRYEDSKKDVTNKKRNRLLEEAHEMAVDLHEAGVIDAVTMREFDALCLPDIHELTPRRIQQLRRQSKMSQAVFARIINVSIAAIKQWERGERKPSGAALKLRKQRY